MPREKELLAALLLNQEMESKPRLTTPNLEKRTEEVPSAGPFRIVKHRGGHLTYQRIPERDVLSVGPYGELMLPGDTTYLP